MEKKNILALLALVVLVGAAVVVMRAPEKGDRVGEKPRPLAEVKATSIASLELTQPGGSDKVTLSKKADKWQVTAPYDKPADQGAAKSAAEALEKIKWGDVTTQQKDRYADLEVSDDKAVHVVAKDSAGALLADLYLGKVNGPSTMVRIAGKDDVWQASDFSAAVFKKDGKSWREHTIFELKADDAQKVTINAGGSQVTLERLPAATPATDKDKAAAPSIFDAKWKLSAGQIATLKPGVELDHSIVNRIAQGVASLRASEFLDAAKPDELGLLPGAAGQVELQVAFKDGKTAGVRIGSQKGEEFHVQALDNPQIFTVKKWSVEPLLHLPQDLGDKSLVGLKAEAIDSITVTQDKDVLVVKATADKSWKADKLPDADPAKLKSLAESFDAVVAAGFVAAAAPELASLAKGKATVVVKPKAGAPIVLKIGDSKGDDTVVQRVGQEPVWLKKFSVDRWTKKPADVGKDKNPPAAAEPPGGMPGMMPPGFPPH